MKELGCVMDFGVKTFCEVFEIVLPLPVNWNKYIQLERGSKFGAASLKKKEKKQITDLCSGKKYEGGFPCQINVLACFKNKRSDLDNLRIKGVLDGLVSAGVIPDDSLNYVSRIVFESVVTDSDGLVLTISKAL